MKVLTGAGTGRRGTCPYIDIDLADPLFWKRPPARRDEAFARLRHLPDPVFFVERPAARGRKLTGFHALVRHRDVVDASRDAGVFTSGPGVTTPKPARWVRFVFGDSMVNLDDPRHARLRGVVQKAFTPRVIAKITEDMAAVASQLVDEVAARGTGDFVETVAAQMPLRVICELMGIPARYRARLLTQLNRTAEHAGVPTPRWRRVPGRSLFALARLQRVVARVGRQRRRHPTDDLISQLVAAKLTARELGAFFSLLLVAGVETTRNAIAHGLLLLTSHPRQRALLLDDFDRHSRGFVEELVRHSTPIIQFRRTVARDTVLNGYRLGAGDEVVLFYTSANRDETVFDAPDAFDITRSPNPHVGFGGGGPHFCLGTALARQEISVLFRELLTRLPAIRSVGEPDLVPSSFDNRVGRLTFTTGAHDA
ncbi:cytochrome P450 [Virgisporangium ochraceum]|uniref:Cytochrome P450 n=1 Tax=Virgisporangium ochraceum TaxID=65505 RepID=A0A8J3ZSE9_9ACTN|nr:cytochrome P450 [Virgisporangium ochraceum]GIJ68148.1 cytochrome P450 [Virgisporangium ochraceum]